MEEHFKDYLEEDEKILFCNRMNNKARLLALIIGIPVICLVLFFIVKYDLITHIEIADLNKFLIIEIIIALFLILFCLLTVKINPNANLFAITNKRIINQSKGFNFKKTNQYSLKNIGNVTLIKLLFDNKKSGTLIIKIKDFHTDTTEKETVLKIIHLENAEEAYKILMSNVNNNNDSYNLNGYSINNNVIKESVNYNEKVTKPDNPIPQEGYKFVGWYLGDDVYNFNSNVTSINEPSLTGTLNDIPSILPSNEGITLPIADAAPVEVGTIFWAHALPRLPYNPFL